MRVPVEVAINSDHLVGATKAARLAEPIGSSNHSCGFRSDRRRRPARPRCIAPTTQRCRGLIRACDGDPRAARMALITGMDSVPHLQIWLLGTFRVRIDSHRVTELDKRLRAAELLKLLALSPGHRLHREEAVELLWPECEPDSAANNLH